MDAIYNTGWMPFIIGVVIWAFVMIAWIEFVELTSDDDESPNPPHDES